MSSNHCKNARNNGFAVHTVARKQGRNNTFTNNKCSGSSKKCVSLRYDPSKGSQGNKISG